MTDVEFKVGAGAKKMRDMGDGTIAEVVATEPSAWSIATGQVEVGTSATLIVGARPGRNKLRIVNHATLTDVFIGAAGVTVSTGVLIPAGKGQSLEIDGGAAVHGVAAAGVTVSFIESY